jgi:hypothetical protein
MTRLRILLIQFGGTALLFSAAVALGTSLTMLLASCMGYLSYSDRPGPGWWAHVHWPSLAEIGNYLGFTPWFAYFCIFFGLGLFLLSIVLGFANCPKWLNRVIGAFISTCCAGLAIAGAGWYLALAPVGPDVAMGVALLYGIILFPRFVVSQKRRPPVWLRVLAVSASVALFGYWIVSPFLPRKALPSLVIQLDRLTPSDDNYRIGDSRFLGEDVQREVAKLGLKGQMHGGIGSSVGSSEEPKVDALLVALEPIVHEAKLALPAHGYVVYVLRAGQWTPYPSFQDKDSRKLLVEPGIDKQFEGGRIKIGDQQDFSNFTWYPTVPLDAAR